jgi:hypothetical protein
VNDTTPADLAAVVQLAGRAPSVHNTQPWRFVVGDAVLTLTRDEDRRLPALDPDARQATISCGAAVHLARLGFRAQGLDAAVDVVRAEAGHLEVRLTGTPGAPLTATEEALVAAAGTRHTQRGPFDPSPVTDREAAAMREAAQAEGVWVRVLDTPAAQVPLAVLLAVADAEQRDDPAVLAEQSAWANRPEGSADGVPAEAASLGRRPRASDLTLRDFLGGEEATDADEPDPDGDDPPVAEHPLVVVIGTEGDTPADWLTAGQALSALLLTAAAAGIQASPLGQVLDQPWARRRLAGELGVVGHPQMVLRMGHAAPGPETPRRPVDELLG